MNEQSLYTTPWSAEITQASSGFGYSIAATGRGFELLGGSWALTLRGARRRAARICRRQEARHLRDTTILDRVEPS